MAPWPPHGESGSITALLGPTNTGKTHRAIEQMLTYGTGMIGLPLRLLAREVYDKITSRIGEQRVALVTGEEKRVPPRPDYWVCTVESMPQLRDVEFVAVDEIQLARDAQRGHTFTDRLLHARGTRETWFLGAQTMAPLVETLLPTARIERHPRFSQLTYTGTQGLGSLPPRSAVVAFSVGDVYALAERLRQRHGGTAVVLGALSPRTRNAQVAMYQAGEVQYMVATDAIGMGLNMDVDRVVFAALEKFDGHAPRPLRTDELAQIAGRAGRYQRDGTFGTLRPLEGLSPQRVHAIENHRFERVHRAVWRNSDLDFTSVDTLLASLRQRPRMRCLQLVEQADDYDALVKLASREDIRARARGPAAVQLLWEVCRIPDFRKLLLDSHVQLLASIFIQLSGPSERLDELWMAKRIERLSASDGDIDTLMSRIAFVRTWTYITHHERWVPRAEHWQEQTRAIEDRHSDALHERLTERFVARTNTKTRSAKTRKRDREEAREGHPFDRLRDLMGAEASQDAETGWAERVVQAPHEAFGVDHRGRITCEGEIVGRLRSGAGLRHPDVLVVHDEAGAGDVARVLRRLQAWLKDAVAALLGPAGRIAPSELGPAGRGVLYQLEQELGTLDMRSASVQLRELPSSDRERLERERVVFGRTCVYVASAMQPQSVRFRAVLWHTHHGGSFEHLPSQEVSLAVTDELDAAYYPHVGFIVCGPVAVRADELQATQRRLDALAARQPCFELPVDVHQWLGCDRAQLPEVLSALGYRQIEGERYVRRSNRSRRRRARGSGRHPNTRVDEPAQVDEDAETPSTAVLRDPLLE